MYREFSKTNPEKISGEVLTKDAIDVMETDYDDPKDIYLAGNVFHEIKGDVPKAYEKYNEALNKIHLAKPKDVKWILDGIDNYTKRVPIRDIDMKTPQVIEEKKIIVAIMAPQIRTVLNNVKAASDKTPHVAWHSNNQNVHDEAINKSVLEQYKKLQEENEKEELDKFGIAHLESWLVENRTTISRYADYGNIRKTMERASADLPVPSMHRYGEPEIKETEVLSEVWKRANSPSQNNENSREALIRALSDCVEAGNLVCTDGRVARYVGSMAAIDTKFGELKTKEAFRNEFYEGCSKIMKSADEKTDIPQKIKELGEQYRDKITDIDELVKTSVEAIQ